MRPTEAMTYIRHIASLGLSSHVAIPLMMDEMVRLIPSGPSPFFWASPDGNIIDMYMSECIPEALAASLGLNRFNTPADMPTLDKMLTGPLSYNNSRTLKASTLWHSSVLKNETLRAHNAENGIDFTLRDRSGYRGMLALSRGERDKDYTLDEIRRVRSLLDHFLHALDSPCRQVSDGIPGDQQTFINCTSKGEIISFSSAAAMLLLRLYDVPIDSGSITAPYLRQLPRSAMIAVDRLAMINSGRTSAPAKVEVPTRWGLFRVSAYRMQGQPETALDQVLVSIEPLIDQQVKRAQQLAQTDLSFAERRVAARMCDTGDGDEIAAALGLTAGSYRQYAKRIYAALNVDGRIGVKALLDG